MAKRAPARNSRPSFFPEVFPMTAPAIPSGAKVRVVGDVHGDATGFAYAMATDRFIVQLGDLPDHGPDSAGTLRMMFDRVEAGRGRRFRWIARG